MTSKNLMMMNKDTVMPLKLKPGRMVECQYKGITYIVSMEQLLVRFIEAKPKRSKVYVSNGQTSN